MHLFVDEKYVINANVNKNSIASSPMHNGTDFEDDIELENASRESVNVVQRTSDDKCWKGYSNYPYLWIITGPMTLVIFVRVNCIITILKYIAIQKPCPWLNCGIDMILFISA